MEFSLFGYKVSIVKAQRDWPTNWNGTKLRRLTQDIDQRIGPSPSKVQRVKELRTYMPTDAEPGSNESIANFREAVALAERMWLDNGYGNIA